MPTMSPDEVNTVEHLYNRDTIGKQHFYPNSRIFSLGVVCIIVLLSTTLLRFQRFTLLYDGRELKAEASTTSTTLTSNVKL